MKRWLWVALWIAGPAMAQDLPRARSLAATCATCHGTDGRARGDALAPLAGMKAEVMLQALADFRSGAQRGTVMPQIVKGYSDEQLRLIAGYLARQSVAPAASGPAGPGRP